MALPFSPRSLLMAPMVGLSHRSLRTLAFGFGGLDIAYTEMASAAALVSGSKDEYWYLDTQPEPERTMLQFYTVKSERLVEALATCASIPALGADINFGCAAPHIERSGGGAAWMAEPAKAAALVRAARAVWPRLLSAKLRLGEEEDYDALRDFCLGLAEAGLDFLSLHPRLKKEKFRRRSRWDYVGHLASELPIPVVGNGDVRRSSQVRELFDEYGPAGIMVGREAVRRPWFFALVRGCETDPGFELEVDLEATALRFLELLEAHLPPQARLTRARRFFYYYADNFSFAHHLRWKTQNCEDLDGMRRVLADYLEAAPGDRLRLESD